MARPSTPKSASVNGAVEAWAARKRHNVVMPSGQGGLIEIPGLGPLVLAGAVPDDYAELARGEITHRMGMMGAYAEQVAELMKSDDSQAETEASELTAVFGGLLKWLVSEHVLKGLANENGAMVEVKLTPEQLSDERFPVEDLDWLYGVAVRRVDEDALGRRLGVARLDEFATFREAHGEDRCPQDCDGCFALVGAYSTVDLGSL